MKKLLFVLIPALATFTVTAQTKSPDVNRFYVDFGGGASTKNGIFAQLGATAVIKNKWTASISYYSVDMNPKNLPSDYEPGATIIVFFPVPDAMPSVDMTLVNFTAGRFFQIGRKTWFTTEAGLSIVSGKTFHFTAQPQVVDWDYMSSNYSAQTKTQTTIGAMLRADFTWAFCPNVGLNVGAFANMNSIQSPVGAEFKLVVGWLNTKKHGK